MRVLLLVKRYLWMTFRSWTRIMELVVSALMVVMWAFAKTPGSIVSGVADYMITVQILWSYTYLVQSMYNILGMEEVWSRSLKDLYMNPVSFSELIIAKTIAVFIKTGITLAFLVGIPVMFFGSALSGSPTELALLFGISFVSSLGVALFLDGVIMNAGREAGFFSWSLNTLFVLFSCPWYSINAFPGLMHPLIYAMPYFHIFGVLQKSSTFYLALISAFSYLVVGFFAYWFLLKMARKNGKFTNP